ncbi:MAG: hypothetical protein WB392_06615 [Methanotrichaceae archaeon]
MPNELQYQKDAMNRAVRLVSEDDIFRSMAYAAMKIKAGKLKPGEIVVINNYEFNVAENEEGTGITVQLIQSRQHIESLAEAKASESGMDLSSLDDRARSDWMWQFLNELKDNLQKWQEIKTISGPGDNLTFSKMVYKWSYSDWK